MLRYDNQFAQIALNGDAVAEATLALAQASLVSVATESGLDLQQDSFTVFTDQIDKVINDPDTEMSPADLLRHAESYALRGAQAMIADGQDRFHEGTWFHAKVCPLWPFC